MPPSTKGKSEGQEAPAESYEDMEETLIRVASAKSLVELSKSASLESNVDTTSKPPAETLGDGAMQRVSASTTPQVPLVHPLIASFASDATTAGAAAATATAAAAASASMIESATPNALLMSVPVAPKPLAPTGRATAQGPAPTIHTQSGVVNMEAKPSSPTTSTTSTTRPSRSTKSKGTSLRRGKWTAEEEAYVARVIHDFNTGFLNAPAGTTLRSYLSEKLQCDPMRITKKFTGDSCIGKRIFHPAVRNSSNAATIDQAHAELDELELRWRRRLEMQQRESAKKAAASAAATSTTNRGIVAGDNDGAAMVQGVPVAMLGVSAHGSNDSQLRQTAVDQAASWLDRANAILKGGAVTNAAAMDFRDSTRSSSGSSESSHQNESTQSSGDSSLENQMKEVQRLLYEGPGVQQATAGLPQLILQPAGTSSSASPHGTPAAAAASASGTSTPPPEPNTMTSQPSPTSEPVDKRLRTADSCSDANASNNAEDAETLVGFLRSVRASAAAGEEM